MKKYLLMLFVLAGVSLFAQKKEFIEDKEAILERATSELDQAMQGPEGQL